MFFLIDVLLIMAMLFFLFLPITDRRTAQMRLCMVCTLLVAFSVSITRTPVVPVLLANTAASPGMVRVSHMHVSEPSSGFSPRPTSDSRLLHGQGNL